MKFFKKSLAVLLCMITVFATMAIGFTASAAMPNPVTEVYVNNVKLTNGKYLAVGSKTATTTKPSGGYAYFNTNKLYLHNYTFSLNDSKYTDGYGKKYRIYADNGVLEIYFSGVNGLECNDSTGYTTYHDIYCYRGKVELCGNQDAVISLSGESYSVSATEGIWAECGTYNLQNGFEASAPQVTSESSISLIDGVFNVSGIGHKANNRITVHTGIHNFNCPTDYAVASQSGDVLIMGGTINSVSGGFATLSNSGKVRIVGGRTNLTANSIATHGIFTQKLEMTEGYLKVTSGNKALYTAFENIPANIKVTASTNQNGSGAVAYNASNNNNYKYFEAKSTNTYDVTINDGFKETTTKAYYNESIGVEPANIAGKKFTKWTLKGVYLSSRRQETDTYIIFTMPKNAVTVTANFETDTTAPVNSKTITVINGTANVSKAATGAIVTITAPQTDGKIFSHWVVTNATVADENAAETTITVGNGDVTAEAVYDDCECKCHQGGIAGFFYKIVLFFQKLFGQNKVCVCGAKH